ncbi:MAG: hypothetical protein FIA92_10235 [Chloroflexi bacterium]|nr:hypothetical protein [Chloroflexota bacterium]
MTLSPRTLVSVSAVVLGGLIALVAAAAMTAAGPTVRIGTAPGEAFAYVPTEVRVAAAGEVVIEFHNDSTVDHNLTFTGPLEGSTRTIVAPGEVERFAVRPPGPASYAFVCTIHEGMVGRLVIEAGSAG